MLKTCYRVLKNTLKVKHAAKLKSPFLCRFSLGPSTHVVMVRNYAWLHPQLLQADEAGSCQDSLFLDFFFCGGENTDN